MARQIRDASRPETVSIGSAGLVVCQDQRQVEAERPKFGFVAARAHLQHHEQARHGIVTMNQETRARIGDFAAPCTASE